MNQYESQAMREQLLSAGMAESKGKNADLCIINTCTVTHKADQESRYQLRRFRRDCPRCRIIVTGCAAAGLRKTRQADLVVLNQDKPRIAATINAARQVKLGREAISFFQGHTRAFLKIQDGCDNFCAYCIVPLARGKPRSKPLEAVRQEARALAQNGYKEIVLTGICLGKYGQDLAQGYDLVDAVEAIEPLEGVKRIRLSSIELIHVTERLAGKLKEQGKLCPHLHVPLQSGDDSVLKRMNRSYRAAAFLSLIRRLKRTVADFSLTTDVMVGFPGETEAAFRNTLRLVRALEPLKVHIFPFSPRPGTGAALMQGRLDPAGLKERVRRLEETAGRAQAAFRAEFAGRRMEVLVEGPSKARPGCWQGYTRNYLEVFLRSREELSNHFRTARITG